MCVWTSIHIALYGYHASEYRTCEPQAGAQGLSLVVRLAAPRAQGKLQGPHAAHLDDPMPVTDLMTENQPRKPTLQPILTYAVQENPLSTT